MQMPPFFYGVSGNLYVIPAQAGIHFFHDIMDSRLRGNDNRDDRGIM